MIPVPVGAARALKIVASVGGAFLTYNVVRKGLANMREKAAKRYEDARSGRAKDVTP